jgi:hypothetical protein
MDELTDAQREALKQLPIAFLAKLRTAVAQKRELDEQMAVEEDRVNRLREVVQDWKVRHETAYDEAMKTIQQRLESSEAGVSQAVAHGDRTKQLQLASLDEQLTRRKAEIDKIEAQISERQASIEQVKSEISDMHVIMEKKRSLLDALASGGVTPRNPGQAVTRRPAMTLYKADGVTQRPAAASFLSPRSNGTPRSAREMLLDEIDRDQPLNTPETAEPLSKIDIDMVPARVVLESLLELILEPSQVLVQTLGAQVRPNEQEKLARCWVEIFASHGEIMDMLQQTILREVENTQEIGTLFRSNSMASRIMSIFSRSIGMEYLKSLLKPKIDAIISANEDLEIDTMKIAGDQIEAQRETVEVSAHVVENNVTKLTEHAIDFLQTIMAGKAKAPLEYYKISSLLKELVRQKFPQQWKIAIGGYLFLRLMCPCIFLPPDDFGYNFETVAPESKRTLVLVSKILQNLANLQPKFVEEIMAPFSKFVTFNMHSLEQYFEAMTNVPVGTPPTSLPEYNIRARLREVLSLASANQARLAAALAPESEKAPEVFTQLWSFNQAPKLLVVYNKLTLAAASGQLSEESPDVTAFIDFLVPPTNAIAPIMKLASRESLVASLPLDQLLHPPPEAHVLSAILETSTRLDFSAVENAELAASLYPVWEYRGRTPELISDALDAFLRSPTKSNRPLLDSVAAHVFSSWCHHLLLPLVKTTLSSPVMQLAGKKESLSQREVLLDISGNFINAIIAALPNLPENLHAVCHRIASSPRFGVPTAAQFILSLLWVKALEDPESWTVPTGGGDRQIKKCLLMVSDIITLVSTAERDKQNAAVDNFLTTSHSKFIDAVTAWIKFSNPKKPSQEIARLPWADAATAIDHLRIFIAKNMSSISAILEKTTSEAKFVKFTIAEAISQMVKHAAAKTTK